MKHLGEFWEKIQRKSRTWFSACFSLLRKLVSPAVRERAPCFSSFSVQEEAVQMEGKYRKYATREGAPDASQAVLLVIDMQEYFRAIAEPIIPTLQQVIKSARKAGIPIIYTQHSHKRPEEDGMLGEWWDGNIIGHGSPEAELLPEVEYTQHDKLVTKHVYSAFVNTDLESHLKKIGRSEVIITGVMTNLCCETTARDAFCRGYRVFLSTDATATLAEEYHVSTLRNLGYGFAYLVDVGSLKFG